MYSVKSTLHTQRYSQFARSLHSSFFARSLHSFFVALIDIRDTSLRNFPNPKNYSHLFNADSLMVRKIPSRRSSSHRASHRQRMKTLGTIYQRISQP